MELEKLSFLTWNLAMMERSDFAPTTWRMDQTEAEIRKIILEYDPDIVCFQELPGAVPFVETHGMVPANTRGQQGDLAILAKHALLDQIDAGVAKHAVFATFKRLDLTIANVHLPSAKGGDHDRLAALIMLAGACPSEHLAIIGDTNVRTAEEKKIAKNGFVGDRPPEPTWNGRLNPFRYGARGYTAYFTRVFHSEGWELSDQRVLTAPIEVAGQRFHLSDHFALFGRLARVHPQ